MGFQRQTGSFDTSQLWKLRWDAVAQRFLNKDFQSWKEAAESWNEFAIFFLTEISQLLAFCNISPRRMRVQASFSRLFSNELAVLYVICYVMAYTCSLSTLEAEAR